MRRLLFLLLLLLPVLAPAQPRAPRDTVAAVAQAIEDNYYDAQRGKQIADELRAANERGEFDARTVPLELASALTAKLHPLDRHFNVRWEAAPPAALPGTRRAPPPPRDTGVKKVEVLPGNLG